jgi:probable F420-dependent oxidoreductase
MDQCGGVKVRIGVVIPTYDHYGNAGVIRRLIGDAERLGYDSVWFGDHLIVPGYAVRQTDPHWYEALSCAILGMGMTQRLSFGMDVLVAPYRHPILLAKMAATASELSSGRLMLGLGVGFLKGEFEALGAPFARRASMTDECLKVLRLLFEGRGPLSHHGEWVSFDDMYFGPAPARPPPLLVGGNHERAIERAARLGDGWHPLLTSPELYARGRARINQIREREGLMSRPFTFSYSCAQTRLLAPGEPPPPAFSQKDQAPGDYGYIPEAARAPDGRQRFIGTAEELRDDIAAFAAAGVDQIVLRFAMPHDPVVTVDRISEHWRLFSAEVMPACRAL